jgi:alpha-L-rhamnosidase
MSRRNRNLQVRMTTAASIALCTVVALITRTSAAAPGAPDGLLCNLLSHPEAAVVTDLPPHFSWQVRDDRRGAVQSARQIVVAASRVDAQAGRGTVWDSGKVADKASVAVEYGGPDLASGQSYWWAVRTWDGADEAGPWSAAQQFHVGDAAAGRTWPGESRWVPLEGSPQPGSLVLENRQTPSYIPLAPADSATRPDGTLFLDFGKDAYGTLEITFDSVDAPRDLEVRLGEKLAAPQTLDTKPGGSIGYAAATVSVKPGQSKYIVELPRRTRSLPPGVALPEPRPEVLPFRYAEIVNAPAALKSASVRQLALFYPFNDQASAFSSSSADLDAVFNLSKYTLKATPFLALYIDGNRERTPYEADALIEQIGHYNVDREFAVARYSHEFLVFHPTWPTEWIMYSVLLAWNDYQYTGDTVSLKKFYLDLQAKTLQALARPDGLISTQRVPPEVLRAIHFNGTLRDIVDWPAGERDGNDMKPINTVVNALHYRALLAMADLADAAGKPEDARAARQQADKVKTAVNALLFDTQRGIYLDGEGSAHASLHANVFPLAFDMVPPERQAKVVEFIKSRGMACGPYGAQFLLDALYHTGQDQTALALLTSDTDRSWRNMIRFGATMTAEAWDIKYKPNLTWNHAWSTAPANVAMRQILGVQPLTPGYATAQICPHVGGLAHAEGNIPTIRGTLEIAYKADASPGRASLAVTIPANMDAELWLPATDAAQVQESQHAPDNTIKWLRSEAGRPVYHVPAGHYQFDFPQ